ncbi:MAG TPA: hypothetical protein VEG08_00960 [Terriglobales bacterium]|nr:hypothetical protein [Terriglobales bacterium]
MKKASTLVVMSTFLLALSATLMAQNNKITVPAGTTLTVRLGRSLSSKTSKPGDTFPATLRYSVKVEGNTVIPAGAEVEGRVANAKKQGAFAGQADLALELISITTHGDTYSITTDTWAQTEKGKGKRTAGSVGGGAAAGAIIGAIAGGGKGAAIGAGLGAGAGTAVAGGTGGKNVNLSTESTLSFRLTQPLVIQTH